MYYIYILALSQIATSHREWTRMRKKTVLHVVETFCIYIHIHIFIYIHKNIYIYLYMYIYIYIDTYTGMCERKRKGGMPKTWKRQGEKQESERETLHAISRCENCIIAQRPLCQACSFFLFTLMYTRVCIELPSCFARCAHPSPPNHITDCRARCERSMAGPRTHSEP